MGDWGAESQSISSWIANSANPWHISADFKSTRLLACMRMSDCLSDDAHAFRPIKYGSKCWRHGISQFRLLHFINWNSVCSDADNTVTSGVLSSALSAVSRDLNGSAGDFERYAS